MKKCLVTSMLLAVFVILCMPTVLGYDPYYDLVGDLKMYIRDNGVIEWESPSNSTTGFTITISPYKENTFIHTEKVRGNVTSFDLKGKLNSLDIDTQAVEIFVTSTGGESKTGKCQYHWINPRKNISWDDYNEYEVIEWNPVKFTSIGKSSNGNIYIERYDPDNYQLTILDSNWQLAYTEVLSNKTTDYNIMDKLKELNLTTGRIRVIINPKKEGGTSTYVYNGYGTYTDDKTFYMDMDWVNKKFNVTVSESGIATWDPLPAGKTVRVLISTTNGGNFYREDNYSGTSFNVKKEIDKLQIKSATYRVTIVLNDEQYLQVYHNDARGECNYNYVSPIVLDAPTNLRWDGKTARWDKVENAKKYSIFLKGYKSFESTEPYYDFSVYADDFLDGRTFSVEPICNDIYGHKATSPEYVASSGQTQSTGDYHITVTSKDEEAGLVSIKTNQVTKDFSKSATIEAGNGTSVQIKAQAKSGYKFDRWESVNPHEDEATEDITEAEYLFSAQENVTYFAYFSKVEEEQSVADEVEIMISIAEYGAKPGTLYLKTDKGSTQTGTDVVSKILKATAGSKVEIKAETNEGYKFERWGIVSFTTGDIVKETTNPEYTFDATEKLVACAYYSKIGEEPSTAKEYSVTVTYDNHKYGEMYIKTDKGDQGTETHGKGMKATAGTTAEINAVASEGYQFDCWELYYVQSDKDEKITTAKYSFVVNEQVMCKAIFSEVGKNENPDEKNWINQFKVEIAEPKSGEKPSKKATPLTDGFTITKVEWTPNDKTFQDGTKYKVKIYVAIEEGRILRSDYFGMVNGKDAEMPGDYDKDKFYIEYDFGKTMWSKASDWAEEELRKASELNVIPELFNQYDLTKNITRKEFAHVAVKLYEKLTGNKAIKSAINPFTDTTDEEVLKALNVGITNGTSETTFDPESLITREQMATMMTRALSKAGIDTAVDLNKVEKFADDAEMHDWGKASIYYMSNIGIIKGMGDNQFGVLGNATREQSLLISERSSEKFGK